MFLGYTESHGVVLIWRARCCNETVGRLKRSLEDSRDSKVSIQTW